MNDRDYYIYMINFFHPTEGADRAGALQRYLLDSVDVIGYWNYIPLTYCIKSRLTANQLMEKISPILHGSSFVIAEVNPHNINGMMPAATWGWFYEPPTEPGNRPPTSAIPLGSLFGLPPPKR